MRYYIIAGERSGDLHAGNLVKSIKKYDQHAIMRGFGGDFMKAAGVDIVTHYADMAVMGFAEVLRSLRKIRGYIRQCKDDIINFDPDVIILVDYGGFNIRIAKFARQKGLKVFYYISPKVWAWYQRRALDLKANVDRMFVILPFEKDFFKKFQWDVDYVGNPVLDAVKAHVPARTFFEDHRISSQTPVIALLPGSRRQELETIIPVMSDVARQYPDCQFVVGAVNNLDKNLYSPLARLSNVKFMYDHTYDLLSNADAAVVTSGTATLETALFKVPQVVVYKTSTVSYHIARWLIQVPFISLVNLIAGKPIVRELIQHDATAENIGEELRLIMTSARRGKILEGYNDVIRILDTGSASENTARLMIKYLTAAAVRR